MGINQRFKTQRAWKLTHFELGELESALAGCEEKEMARGVSDATELTCMREDHL